MPTVPTVQRDAAPAVETEAPAGALVLTHPDAAPAVDQGDTVHGAHPQRFHVLDRGEVEGYRFHLVRGSLTKQIGKALRSALLTVRAQYGAITVTAPRGSATINVGPGVGNTVTDWAGVLAFVAGQLGDAIDATECGACDRSAALVDA